MKSIHFGGLLARRRMGDVFLVKEMGGIISVEYPTGLPAMPARPRPDPVADETALLTKAVLRAADRLAIKNAALAKILGLSGPTISRMRGGKYRLERGQKPFELAVLLIRLYRSLDGIVGGDDKVAADWLTNKNTVLDGVPLELIQSVSGLANVIHYLDARRAVV